MADTANSIEFNEMTIMNRVYDPVLEALDINMKSGVAGEDLSTDRLLTEDRYTYTMINTATTTLVKTGIGLLKRIIVNGGTTGTITIYDNTTATGNKIADFDTTNALTPFQFDVEFIVGLTIVTSAATKVTVVWR